MDPIVIEDDDPPLAGAGAAAPFPAPTASPSFPQMAAPQHNTFSSFLNASGITDSATPKFCSSLPMHRMNHFFLILSTFNIIS